MSGKYLSKLLYLPLQSGLRLSDFMEGKLWRLKCILGCFVREKDERERVVKMREIDREKVMATFPPQSDSILTLSKHVEVHLYSCKH